MRESPRLGKAELTPEFLPSKPGGLIEAERRAATVAVYNLAPYKPAFVIYLTLGAIQMAVSDYFAELYVAGRFADAGWNVYFPHRDKGFDFIVSKPHTQVGQLIRPVQVKGKYPTEAIGDKTVYGYIGRLTQTHPEMVLAIPYFSQEQASAPSCVAYLPFALVRTNKRGYRCQPATFSGGRAEPRRDYRKFFDANGLTLLEKLEWKNTAIRDRA